MKALDKMPTDEVLDEVAQNDVLERNELVANFIHLLTSIEGHYSIAINGRWGTGKTFFVKQTKRVLEQLSVINASSRNQGNKVLASQFITIFQDKQVKQCNMIPVYYDAWEHDTQQDALLSLVLEINRQVNGSSSSLNPEKSIADKAKIGFGRVVSSIIEHFSGIDLLEIAKALKNDDLTTQAIANLRHEDDLRTIIVAFFQNLTTIPGSKIIVFIDELDRCRPDYAVQLLERVKHYMLIDNVVFVFSVNLLQLQHTIKRFYGENFDANLYLNRFFDWVVLLPMPNVFKQRGGFEFGLRGSCFNDWCHIIADHFDFEIREQIHFYETINLTLRLPDYSFSVDVTRKQPFHRALDFLLYYFAPLALGLRIHSISRFYDFIDGHYNEAIEILARHKEVFPDNALKLLGYDDKTKNKLELKSILDQLYNAVFGRTYLHCEDKESIGLMEVEGHTKQKFLEEISSLNVK